MIKTGVIGVFLAAAVIFVFYSVSSSAVLEREVYVLGENVKIDLTDFDNFRVKIRTPSSSYAMRGKDEVILFKPEEVGSYSVRVQSGGEEESYSFEVVSSESKLYDSIGDDVLDELKKRSGKTEGQVVINERVKWKKIFTSNGTGSSAVIPESEDVSVFKVSENGKEEVDFEVSKNENNEMSLVFSEDGEFEIEYYTGAPMKSERVISERVKEVKVFSPDELHYENVLSYAEIPERVKSPELIKIHWKEENVYLDFEAFDKDGNGILDYVEWVAPHLSEQTFEIILITKADHLDENRDFIEDVYELVKARDGVWTDEIPNEHYIRVVFEKELSFWNDITIYARSSTPDSRVEVYEKNGTEKIADFGIIEEDKKYKIFLTNLQGSQDTFDLKIIGGVEFDYIVDPQETILPESNSVVALGTSGCTVNSQCVNDTSDLSYVSNGGTSWVEDRYNIANPSGSGVINNVTVFARMARGGSSGPSGRTLIYTTAVYYGADNSLGSSWADYSTTYSNNPNTSAWTWDTINSMEAGVSLIGGIGTRIGRCSEVWVVVDYTPTGDLNGTLNEPSVGSVNVQTIYEVFSVNATVVCLGDPGDTCGVVSGGARYNSSGSEPDTFISTTGGAQPFFADLGSQSCGSMSQGDSCELVWEVNATQVGIWNIDVLFNSSLSPVTNNDTLNAEVETKNPPALALNLTSPTSDPGISEGGSFELNCSAACTDQDCESVEVFATYCDGSGCSPDEILNTGTSDLTADVDSVSLGTISAGTTEVASFNISGNTHGDYVIGCNASSSNAGNPVSPTNLSLHVNDFPVANFTYPINGTWLHGTENLNGSASTDSDGSITNYLFEIDNETTFGSADTLCNGASENCTFDSSGQSQCDEESWNCYLRLTVTDDDATTNYTVIRIGIDNTGASVDLDRPANNTYITSESYTINASASDSGSGVSCVEFSFYNGSWNVITADCAAPYEHAWDLSSIPDQVLEVRARANDSEGNFGSYDPQGNVTHDVTKPSITLHYPENGTYLDSSTQIFNFTVTDSVAQTLDCFLILDGVVNQTNTSVLNGTVTAFTVENLDDSLHEWQVNCSDYVGNENKSEARVFTTDTILPSVSIITPLDNAWLASNGVEFNYTPVDTNLDSCALYGNWSGGWHLNETNTSVVNGSVSSFNKDIVDGLYIWNVWCNDSAGNSAFNSNFTLGIDTVYPQIDYNPSTTANGTMSTSTSIFVNVTATDDNNDSVRLGWQAVNETFDSSSGDDYWENKTGLSEGTYNFYAWINDSAGNLNLTETRTVIVDLTAPNWTNQNQTTKGVEGSIVHRGDGANLSAYWGDNYGLSTAWLATNETGVWENKTIYSSPQSISGTGAVSAFNWTNASVNLGQEVFWKIYANDSAGNLNVTDEMSFTIWGWSEIGAAYFVPSGISPGEFTTMNCKAQGNITTNPIANYPISFYNSTDLMGTNLTGADGIAVWTLNVTELGMHTFTCNISDNATVYYNASANNEGSAQLGVGYGLYIYDFTDSTNNKAYEGSTANTIIEINDPYSDLTDNDGTFQDHQVGLGSYSYTRFEFKVDEDPTDMSEINITWSGYGDVGSGTDGFILYVYNVTLGNWQAISTYTTNNAEQLVTTIYTDGFADLIDGSDYLKVLVRSYSAAPTVGPPGDLWALVATDFIQVQIRTDILAPEITFNEPVDYYNSSSQEVNFSCYVDDDYKVVNVSLYGNWSGWHLNETNSSGLDEVNYTFSRTFAEGIYLWSCYACDRAGNCQFGGIDNMTLTVDLTAPVVNLLYPVDNENFSSWTVLGFNFSATDNFNSLVNCSLYGNWSTGWHLNETLQGPSVSTVENFSSVYVGDDGYYIWNVECFDDAGNSGFNSTNFTFAAFLPPDSPNVGYFNITQTANDGTGNVTLYWNSSNHSLEYWVYSADSLAGAFTLINKTSNLNYTDLSFAGNVRRFYRVDAWNPTGQNQSESYFGAHVYTLRHNGNTRNWIGFPTNASYLKMANDSLYEIRNATAFTMWNGTIQKRMTCNKFSCP
ncbi:MAG: Ig-like domain-containing protein, partial [Nanoarchaeota archaeon]